MSPTRIGQHIRANLIGYICLFWLTTGTAAAATHFAVNSIGTPQLRSHAVTNAKLANGAVTAAKVRAGSLLAKDFKAGQLPAGAIGPQGVIGPQGPKGDKGDKGLKGDTGAKGDTGPAGPQTNSTGQPNAIGANLDAYFLDTGLTKDYAFGQVHLHTNATAGTFSLCTDVGTVNYVAYVNGVRTAGTVSGCTSAFNVGAGGDFQVEARRAVIWGVHSGDSVTNKNYTVYGITQL